MRTGARGLRGVLGSAWMENDTAGDGGLQRSGFSVHIRWCPYRTTPLATPAQAHGTANRRVGRAVPVTPPRGVTGEPHARHCTADPAHPTTYPTLRELPHCGADIPVCARPRGQTRMSAPHYHAPSLRLAGTASPHLCLRAFSGATPALDDSRRQSTTAYHPANNPFSPNYIPPLQS